MIPIKRLSKQRMMLVFGIFLLTFLVILIRIIAIVVATDGPWMVVKNSGYAVRNVNVHHPRGRILDRNGEMFAFSVPTYDIFLENFRIHDITLPEYERLCDIVGYKYKRLCTAYSNKPEAQYFPLNVTVNSTTLTELEALDILGLNIRAIRDRRRYKRVYPNNRLASHVIGFVSKDGKTMEGIEYQYNTLLSHIDRKRIGDDTAVIPSHDIQLTIDKYIQAMVEDELRRAFNKNQSYAATCIVIDPNDGGILACANMPDFNPNTYNTFAAMERRNRALIDAYEPGSVMKVFTTSIALMEGVVSSDTTYVCPGYKTIGNKKIHCWRKHGSIHFSDAVKESCNTAMIEVALSIPKNSFYNFLRSFGFGSRTGIDYPSESPGILRPAGKWGDFTRGSVAIGQEISVSPLQLVSAASVIAADGILYQPHFLDSIYYHNGTVMTQYQPMRIRQVMTPAVCKKTLELLRTVLEPDGTGAKAAIDGYDLAGKTGTAQIAKSGGGGYYSDRWNTSFIGYVPADHPQAVVLLIFYRPKGDIITGGEICAPVFQRIATRMVHRLNISTIPEEALSDTTMQTHTAAASETGSTSKSVVREAGANTMPNFDGLTVREARELARTYNIYPYIVNSGYAVRQDPPAWSELGDGPRSVTIWFSPDTLEGGSE